jgi:hypothetical protein
MGSKTFYTDRDIEDLASRGVSSLEVNDDIYLTDLAREKAERRGLKLVRGHDSSESALIPSQNSDPSAVTRPAGAAKPDRDQEMFERVRTAVLKRVGEDVDRALLDTIIRRVLANIG